MNFSVTHVLTTGGAEKFGYALISNIDLYGFGILSKNDFEALMFHHLMLNIDRRIIKNNYDLMRLLKITPSKLRSLEALRSAKYLTLDLTDNENKSLILHALEDVKVELENKDNGKVRVNILDLHVYRLIEKVVVENGSSVDYTLNKSQLVLKYTEFLKLIGIVTEYTTKKNLFILLKEDKSIKAIKKEYISFDSMLADLKTTFKEKSSEEIAKMVIENSISILKNKLGLSL